MDLQEFEYRVKYNLEGVYTAGAVLELYPVWKWNVDHSESYDMTPEVYVSRWVQYDLEGLHRRFTALRPLMTTLIHAWHSMSAYHIQRVVVDDYHHTYRETTLLVLEDVSNRFGGINP